MVEVLAVHSVDTSSRTWVTIHTLLAAGAAGLIFSLTAMAVERLRSYTDGYQQIN